MVCVSSLQAPLLWVLFFIFLSHFLLLSNRSKWHFLMELFFSSLLVMVFLRVLYFYFISTFQTSSTYSTVAFLTSSLLCRWSNSSFFHYIRNLFLLYVPELPLALTFKIQSLSIWNEFPVWNSASLKPQLLRLSLKIISPLSCLFRWIYWRNLRVLKVFLVWKFTRNLETISLWLLSWLKRSKFFS